jgi:polyhydroxyalkanoate synthase
MSTETTESAAADAVAAPLDLLLTDAALGALRRMIPDGSGLRLAAALAARPRLVAGRTRNLLGELARIAAGTSQVQPSRRDRRFADPGWAANPLLRRVLQAYLAAAQTAEGLAQDADLDWADTERVGFVLRNLIDALAPSNNPVLNPAALKAAIDTGGGSALAGLRNFAADMAAPPRIPSMVEPDAFKVGVDLAVTQGSVVLRTPVFELIQYRPATAAVRQVPLLIVPPTINKFYVIDLAPGRSMAEYLVGQWFPGVHDVLAQPGLQARQVGLRHLRSGGARRHGRGRADHGERAGRAHRGLLGRHHRRDGRRALGAHRPAGPDRRADHAGHRA